MAAPLGQASVGLPSTQINSSSRITDITDSVTKYTWLYGTFKGQPHVTGIYHYQTPGQQFWDAQFSYTTATIAQPFTGLSWSGTASQLLLTQINFTGSPAPFVFAYNTSGEINKITF